MALIFPEEIVRPPSRNTVHFYQEENIIKDSARRSPRVRYIVFSKQRTRADTGYFFKLRSVSEDVVIPLVSLKKKKKKNETRGTHAFIENQIALICN